ncbi:MAG: 30S ribosome-binding factor RbfA [Candidatus Adiutrix sp.]|jgi:ribosome-binding factor A|nr:30S ribosome-binding factor RbfA [Candidatus Adiutrix sp.]
MSQRRLEKMSELLRETIADLLLLKSKDPRLKQVNVTGVKLTADFKRAQVSYSVFGGTEGREAAKLALARASGFVRAYLGETLNLKYTPEISFRFDRNLEYAQHMAEILNALPSSGPAEPD